MGKNEMIFALTEFIADFCAVICFALGSVVFQIQGVCNFLIRFEPLLALVPSFAFFNLMIRFLFVLINNNHCKYCLAWELSKCERKLFEYTFRMQFFFHYLGYLS